MDSPPGDLERTQPLLEQARQGDAEALNRLFQLYEDKLEAFIRARLPRSARPLLETGDVFQEARLKAFEKLDRFAYRGPLSFWRWLRQIALNHIIDHHRKISRRPAQDGLGRESRLEVKEEGAQPLDGILKKEEISAFESALERVPEKQREVLLLRLELRASFAEIAQQCDFPSPDAARNAYNRWLAKLSEWM